MNKFFARIVSGLIRNKDLRHKVRHILLNHPEILVRHHFFIPENIGGSFKRYFLENEIQDKLSCLKSNLDGCSQAFVDTLVERILNYPEFKYGVLSDADPVKAFDALATPEERELVRIKNEEFPDIVAHLKFPHMDITDYFASFLLFCNGLYFLKEKGAQYVKDKDVLDVGSSFGDSALGLLTRYAPRKVYSFDVSLENIKNYKEMMSLNGIPDDKYIIIDKAVSDKSGTISVVDREDWTSLLDSGSEGGGRTVETIVLDEFVEQQHLQPKFVKIDVEGFELAVVRGMKMLLKNNRPIVAVSMYHNPEQFFELKPLLESYVKDLNYTIEIRPLSLQLVALVDYMIFAYPSEISVAGI